MQPAKTTGCPDESVRERTSSIDGSGLKKLGDSSQLSKREKKADVA